jgi:aspartate carbamoyltransferase catalytic subunit
MDRSGGRGMNRLLSTEHLDRETSEELLDESHDFAGALRIAIIGDIRHSRVARSDGIAARMSVLFRLLGDDQDA